MLRIFIQTFSVRANEKFFFMVRGLEKVSSFPVFLEW